LGLEIDINSEYNRTVLFTEKQKKVVKMVKMSNRKYFYFVAVALFTILTGCGTEEKFAASEPICLQGYREPAMQAGEEVLDDLCFIIEKYDVDKGLIRTRPLSGAQSFEFWRGDNVGAFNTAEANLQSIQRAVELSFSESDGRVCLRCRVYVERLSIPDKQISSISGLSGAFTTSDASLQRLQLNPEQAEKMVWLQLGPDAALERKILGLIENKIVKLAGQQ